MTPFTVLLFPQCPEHEVSVIRVHPFADRNTQLPAQLKGGYPQVIRGILAIREMVHTVCLARHVDF
jgi:hypothetical protein